MRRALVMALAFTLTVLLGGGAAYAHSEKVGEEYEEVVNPIEVNEKTLEAGKNIYLQRCAACHGANGKGAYPGMPDLTDHEMMAEMSEAVMFQKVSEGVKGTSMPPWEDILTEEERWMVINYLNTMHHPEEAHEAGLHQEEQGLAAAPKKGICGPTAVLLFSVLPAVLLRRRLTP